MEFHKLIRLMIPYTVQGVLKAPRLAKSRVVDHLGKLHFITKHIDFNDDETRIVLEILDEASLFSLLAGEAHRFLLASRLTLHRAYQPQPQNAAWQTIEHYYAAFYSVHYLIRTTGISLTNVDDIAQKSIIRHQLSSGGNKPKKVPTGKYLLNYDDQTRTLSLVQSNRRGPGGSHQDAWKLWLELIDKLNAGASADPQDFAASSIILSGHKSFLIRSSGKYNPPELRGEINYQFKGGSWIFEREPDAVKHLQSAILNNVLRGSEIRPTTRSLIAHNNIIIEFAKSLFIHSSRSYPKAICNSLLNQYRDFL